MSPLSHLDVSLEQSHETVKRKNYLGHHTIRDAEVEEDKAPRKTKSESFTRAASQSRVRGIARSQLLLGTSQRNFEVMQLIMKFS